MDDIEHIKHFECGFSLKAHGDDDETGRVARSMSPYRESKHQNKLMRAFMMSSRSAAIFCDAD